MITKVPIELKTDYILCLTRNEFFQYAIEYLRNCETNDKLNKTPNSAILEVHNFLEDVVDALEGVKKIQQVCQQLPKGLNHTIIVNFWL